MTDLAIQAKGLGKKYLLAREAKEKYLSLRDVVGQKTRSMFGLNGSRGSTREFWAVSDLDFEIQKGEAVGIIGRNGAGKSTLLKLLSRITEPTTGRVEIHGRVASLLEVGTGFHPELTGRENIFLNGAILGMRRSEIRAKFDEIVSFAGVEEFLDLPVKRYSSGMYLRLAFAVAAHLEPEILLVDEVLAVGDAEFQKKCLGKMNEVSRQGGRTVLFVSHNMTAIKSLCKNGFLLDKGRITSSGPIDQVVLDYIRSGDTDTHRVWSWDQAPGNEKVRLLEIEINGEEDALFIDRPLSIRFRAKLAEPTDRPLNFSLVLVSNEEVPAFNVSSEPVVLQGNCMEATCVIPAELLNDNYYRVQIMVVADTSHALMDVEDAISFKMMERSRISSWHDKWVGAVRPQQLIKWDYKPHNSADAASD